METRRIIKCAVACLDSEGAASLFPVRVSATVNQYEEGHHFDTAAQAAEEAGYDATPAVFDELSDDMATKLLALFDWVGDKEIETVECVAAVLWTEDCSDSQFNDLPAT